MFYVPLQRWPIFSDDGRHSRGCPCARQADGRPIDYSHVSTPVADAICDRVNIEIKVQPTSGENEMRQIAAAIGKLASDRNVLRASVREAESRSL